MVASLVTAKTVFAGACSCFDGPMKLRLAAVLAFTVLLGGQAKPDREFQECPECPQMVGLPAGKFLMGSPSREAGRFDSEGPQHPVTIKAFALSKYPVTSEQFLAF